MSDSPSKKADAYLQTDNQDLQLLFKKLKALERLQQQIAAFIDPEMAPYCQVANQVDNKLVLLAANGSIATRIRFQTVDLLRKFQQDPTLRHIKYIECKVRPDSRPPAARLTQKEGQKMACLSSETAEMIQAMAESLDDPKLKEVMQRIAKRTT